MFVSKFKTLIFKNKDEGEENEKGKEKENDGNEEEEKSNNFVTITEIFSGNFSYTLNVFENSKLEVNPSKNFSSN